MRFDRRFLLAAGALLLVGVAAWLWVRLESIRLFSPDLDFERNPRLRIVHVLDVHPLRYSAEYSLYGDGRLAVEVWEHVKYPSFFREGKRLESLGYLPSLRPGPRRLGAREFKLGWGELRWLWSDLARSGVLGLDMNLLGYQLRRFGDRRGGLEWTIDGPPPVSIEVEIDSGTRQTRFSADHFRELADLYPELPALAGAVRLLDRLAGYGIDTLDAGRAAAEGPRSTGQSRSSLQ